MKEFVYRLFKDPATIKKFIVALVGAIGVAVSLGLLPDSWGEWAAVISAFLSSIGVYGLKNKTEPPKVVEEL